MFVANLLCTYILCLYLLKGIHHAQKGSQFVAIQILMLVSHISLLIRGLIINVAIFDVFMEQNRSLKIEQDIHKQGD